MDQTDQKASKVNEDPVSSCYAMGLLEFVPDIRKVGRLLSEGIPFAT